MHIHTHIVHTSISLSLSLSLSLSFSLYIHMYIHIRTYNYIGPRPALRHAVAPGDGLRGGRRPRRGVGRGSAS